MDVLTLELGREAALVLYEWLARFDQTGSAAFEDQAEQRVLWDVEALLERQLLEPFEPAYLARLALAREAVRDSTE